MCWLVHNDGSTIVHIFQTLMTWERLDWYPFLGLYFCGCSFMCIHGEPYVAPGGSQCKNSPWPAVHRIYSRNGRHLPLQFSPHGPSMCHTQGRMVQGFPPSFSSNPFLDFSYFLGGSLIFPTHINFLYPLWTVNIVLLFCATVKNSNALKFWPDSFLWKY